MENIRNSISLCNSVIMVSNKFINKCETGRAKSKETLSDLFKLKNEAIILKTILEKEIVVSSEFEIEESEKYPGCYNIYNKNGNRIRYFCVDDDKNKQRADEWVKTHSNLTK